MYTYLSGSIDFSPDKGKFWRDDITPFLENMNIKVLNPLKHVFYGTDIIDTIKRPLMAKMLEEERYEELREEMKMLVRCDLRCVDLSSFIVVNYDVDRHLCGTLEEIIVANKQSKPCLVVAKDKKKLPSWLYGRFPSSHIFSSWEELKKYLTAINSDPNYQFSDADKKRWLFFDGTWMK
jgi:hypothetical protein